MSAGSALRERLALGVVLLALPAAFVFFLLVPNVRGMNAMKAELESIRARLEALPTATPLNDEERRLLEAPAAPWKGRIPSLRGDPEHLAHYARVVTDLEAVLRGQGLRPCGIRSSWDPIRASFSLPGHLDPAAGATAALRPGPDRPQAWVVEVRFEGPPADLFKGLRALPAVGPLLEPVGLRWEQGAEVAQQSLILRNYVLGP